MPKLSIVIPTYNNALYLSDALKSIFHQTFKDYEIIVVDDGSTDNTRDIIKKFEERIRYIYQPNSGGASKPRNEGIKVAKGKYIAVFDADDLMVDGKLKIQVNFLDNHPEIDFIFTDFCNFEGDTMYPRHSSTCIDFRSILNHNVGEDQYIIGREDGYRTLLLENYVGTSSMMFKPQLIDKVGLFDETIRIGEDRDFCFRVTDCSNMGYIDRVCHLRRLHNASMMTRKEITYSDPIRVFEKQLNVRKNRRSQKNIISQLGKRYYSLGYYYRSNGRYVEALKTFLKGVRRAPANPELYSGLLKAIALLALRRKR